MSGFKPISKITDDVSRAADHYVYGTSHREAGSQSTLKSLLRICLDAYRDPETGLSGREMLEELMDDVDGIVRSQPSVYGALGEHAAALRRLLDEGE